MIATTTIKIVEKYGARIVQFRQCKPDFVASGGIAGNAIGDVIVHP
jgi:hypothetical protein